LHLVSLAHSEQNNKCPKSVLLETCHASVVLDIEGSMLTLVNFSFSSYHGENVNDCATEALDGPHNTFSIERWLYLKVLLMIIEMDFIVTFVKILDTLQIGASRK